ncbi:MAG: hypothetical protein IH921_06390, partial [Gemmatimonadetes bacterium]|nr:hypothetical protein [Gemmatimonadota bacterium]
VVEFDREAGRLARELETGESLETWLQTDAFRAEFLAKTGSNYSGPTSLAELSVDDIKSIIGDFQRSQDDHTIMRLYGFRRRLEAEPRPELFDVPTSSWLREEGQRHHSIEVDYLVDHALAASIRTVDALTSERLWNWTINVRDDVWSKLGAETAKALAAWLDAEAGRDVALFAAILATEDVATGSWVVGNTYTITTNRSPSAAIIRNVLDRAAAAPTKAGATRLLEIAALDTLSLENSVARSRTLAYLAQVALRALEVGDLEERLKDLETAVRARSQRTPGRRR